MKINFSEFEDYQLLLIRFACKHLRDTRTASNVNSHELEKIIRIITQYLAHPGNSRSYNGRD